MANEITAYNPMFHALEALPIFMKKLGFANRVHRGFDNERKSFNMGDTIRIKTPSSFTTQAGGTGTPQDVDTKYTDIVLSSWREVPMKFSDKELAYTGEQIIADHIEPAAIALANKVDLDLKNLCKDIPWSHNSAATITYADFLSARKVLRQNAGVLLDTPGVHFAIDDELEATYLGMDQFNNASVVGGPTGLMDGSIGRRANVDFFVNQNLGQHAGGTVLQGSDQAGALSADVAKGATTVALASLAADETIKQGDSFVIAGNTQRYVATADVTLSGTGTGTVSIFPAAVQAYSSGAVVTFELDGAANHCANYYENVLYHENAFALAFAPLPDIGNGAGADMFVATDPQTGLSLRARKGYDNDTADVRITLDVLYGVKTLDPNLAVIYRRNA